MECPPGAGTMVDIQHFLATISNPAIASGSLVRGVAQLGSVSEWGSEGRRFESCRPDKKKGWSMTSLLSQ